ncbi:hypothetical protein [Aquisphaera insulae]|uniref:hypothetical protein n=1 Tax=Aquisphaera insulae TaxID=2712864 RepID=UPI0013EC0832|nr:hypothetical protein [Aquisphaera insulae]
MPTDHRPMVRGPMRTWLKFVLESGLLETLAPCSSTAGEPPLAYARGLLARLREADGGLRPDDPLAVEFRELRSWVEAERRARLSKTLAGEPRRRRVWATEESPPAGNQVVEKPIAVGKPEKQSARLPSTHWLRWVCSMAGRRRIRTLDLGDPLWDRWIDG